MSEGSLILALSRLDADDVVPYNTKTCDKAGTPMSDPLWELVQSCFAHKAAVRPNVSAIADMLSGMKLAALGGSDAHKISSAFTASAAPAGPASDAHTLDPRISSEEHATGTHVLTSAVYGKGQPPVHLEDEFWTVRFGP
jgi:hypothetical protein